MASLSENTRNVATTAPALSQEETTAWLSSSLVSIAVEGAFSGFTRMRPVAAGLG